MTDAYPTPPTAKESKAVLVHAAPTILIHGSPQSLGLREVAAAAGRSTTAIFQNFGGKDGLLTAVLKAAFERDRTTHAVMVQELEGLRIERWMLEKLIVDYVIAQARDETAWLWLDAMFNASHWPVAANAVIVEWYDMQSAFWEGLLGDREDSRSIATIIVDVTTMERAYAAVLHRGADYRLVLSASVSRLLDRIFDEPSQQTDVLRNWVAERTPRAEPDPVGAPLAERLLQVAAEEVLKKGVGALNHRRITQKAQVSTSAIVYHFGNMDTFAERAIWRALITGMPSFLTIWQAPAGVRQTGDEWYKALDMAVTSGDSESTAFYVSYGRIVGQTCLMARERPDWHNFLHRLRMNEGLGITYASTSIWPLGMAMEGHEATAFAIWVKGFAIIAMRLSDAGRVAAPERLAEALATFRLTERSLPKA